MRICPTSNLQHFEFSLFVRRQALQRVPFDESNETPLVLNCPIVQSVTSRNGDSRRTCTLHKFGNERFGGDTVRLAFLG